MNTILEIVAILLARVLLRKVTEKQITERKRKYQLNEMIDICRTEELYNDNEFANKLQHLLFSDGAYVPFFDKWKLTPTSKLDKLFYLK